ncbi:hypothetical protein JTB14_028448 [Gonioctena quinquepunctata]|nr:hypothetical protein JTB14_028448 [Gonioctena quinquepunctata]
MKAPSEFLVLLSVLLVVEAIPLKLNDGSVEISLEPTSNGLILLAKRGSEQVLSGTIGLNIDFTDKNCSENNVPCDIANNSTLTVNSDNGVHTITWEAPNTVQQFKDCFDLGLGDTFWFGGPQRYVQVPLERQVLNGNDPYVIKKGDNFAVAERYWLNSKGAYVFVEDKVPLFVDQNSEQNGTVCFIAKASNPYINRNRTILKYHLGIKDDSRIAHLHAINTLLGNRKDIQMKRW